MTNIIVAMCLVACCIACSSEGKANRMLDDANEAIDEGKLKTAIELFEEIDRHYPTTSAAATARESIKFYRALARAESTYPHRQTRDTMIRVARTLQLWRDRRGRWPGSLDDVDLPVAPVDAWGRRLFYERAGRRGYKLASFGADASPGGDGDAADLVIENGAFVRGN